MLELRDYQVDLIDRVRVALRSHRRVVAQLPTGGGKTALSTTMLKTVASKGFGGMFTVHRQELVDQTIRTFTEFGLPYGVISAGYKEAPRELIQIASIDTLRARLRAGWRPKIAPKLIVADECHHAAAGGWAYVLSEFADAKIIGLTATPERLDGRGLDEQFDHMECGPSTGELIRRGYLSKYRPFCPSPPDLTGAKTKMGDFVKRDIGGIMDKSSITGDAISHYLAHARDRRALVFCVSVEHSQHVVQQAKDAGIVAWHLDGETNRGERRQAITAFRRGEIKMLSNVDLFGEGFDVPAADVSIMLRPTRSKALFLQQCGRVLRPLEGKAPAILLDHAGNIHRHGLPCDEREWSLAGVDKQKGEAPAVEPKTCPKCMFTHRAGPPKCPNCGFKYDKQSREVDQVEGVLSEVVDLAALRKEKKEREAAEKKAVAEKRIEENRRARTIDDLVELGKLRGYREPEKWAAHVYTARVGSTAKRYGQ